MIKSQAANTDSTPVRHGTCFCLQSGRKPDWLPSGTRTTSGCPVTWQVNTVQQPEPQNTATIHMQQLPPKFCERLNYPNEPSKQNNSNRKQQTTHMQQLLPKFCERLNYPNEPSKQNNSNRKQQTTHTHQLPPQDCKRLEQPGWTICPEPTEKYKDLLSPHDESWGANRMLLAVFSFALICFVVCLFVSYSPSTSLWGSFFLHLIFEDNLCSPHFFPGSGILRGGVASPT